MEINDEQREEIARLIKEGYDTGRLDEEDGTKVWWELKTNIWKD